MLVRLENIQSIRRAEYNLEEKGVTQIIGENSNGKSILIKAMAFIANNLISDKDERETLINDHSDFGTIELEREGMRLFVRVDRSRENCYYRFTSSNGSSITRTIREGGLDKLAEEFGFVSFDGGVCLQIFETFGIMPFVNNRISSDYEIIDYIITDKVASAFVDNYQAITFPAFKQAAANLKNNIAITQNRLQQMTFYDIPRYEEMKRKLKFYSSVIQYMSPCSLKKLSIPVPIKYGNLKPVELKKLPMLTIIKPCEQLLSVKKHMEDYLTALSGVCPTCGTEYREVVTGGI